MSGSSALRVAGRILAAVGVLVVLFALFNLFQPSNPAPRPNVAFSEFLGAADRGEIADVTFLGNNIMVRYKEGGARSTYGPSDIGVVRQLIDKGVRVTVAPSDENSPTLLGVLVSWLPFVIMIGFWWYFVARPLRLIASSIDRLAVAQQNSSAKPRTEAPS